MLLRCRSPLFRGSLCSLRGKRNRARTDCLHRRTTGDSGLHIDHISYHFISARQTASKVDNRTMPQTSISPMLSVRRGAQAVEFYKSAFGADVLYRIDSPDGAVVARLSVDGAEFWVADESPEHMNFSPETLAGGTVRMVMTVTTRMRRSPERWVRVQRLFDR